MIEQNLSNINLQQPQRSKHKSLIVFLLLLSMIGSSDLEILTPSVVIRFKVDTNPLPELVERVISYFPHTR
jgi:hypothetical protein